MNLATREGQSSPLFGVFDINGVYNCTFSISCMWKTMMDINIFNQGQRRGGWHSMHWNVTLGAGEAPVDTCIIFLEAPNASVVNLLHLSPAQVVASCNLSWDKTGTLVGFSYNGVNVIWGELSEKIWFWSSLHNFCGKSLARDAWGWGFVYGYWLWSKTAPEPNLRPSLQSWYSVLVQVRRPDQKSADRDFSCQELCSCSAASADPSRSGGHIGGVSEC